MLRKYIWRTYMQINSRLFKLILLCFFVPLLHSACSKDRVTSPVDGGQAWMKTAIPEDLGWSAAKLNEVENFSKQIGTAAVVVLYDGYILASWGDIEFKYLVHSIRKSYLSALYGIHVDLGNVNLNKSIAELGIDDTPNALTETEKLAKISDLLKARSGIYLPAAAESQSTRDGKPPRGSHGPGTNWVYNNWDFNSLGTIFEQETNTKIFEEYKKRIADPLEMEHYNIDDGYYYYQREFSTHPAYHFRMTTMDMARFGLLYMRNGKWKGEQIVPEDWIEESLQWHSTVNEVVGYGYMWWIIKDAGYMAIGYGGHYIHVIPDEKLVIVHRANTDDGPLVTQDDYWTLQDRIRKSKLDL